MIWGALFASGVLAFLTFFFWGRLRWLLLWALGLIAAVASIGLQASLMDSSGYRHFVESAAQIGWYVLVVAVTAFVADFAALATYTIRHGSSDGSAGEVLSEERPMTGLTLGIPPPAGRSKRRILGRRHRNVSMKSLANGTATFSEKVFVLSMLAAFILFGFAWVGAGLMLLKRLLILGLVPVLPVLWVSFNLRRDWLYYRDAKQEISRRGGG